MESLKLGFSTFLVLFFSLFLSANDAFSDTSDERTVTQEHPGIGILPSDIDLIESSSWQGSNGFEFSGGVTSLFQSTSGVSSSDTKDQTDFSYTVDLELIYNHDERYYVVIAMEAGEGNGINDNFPSDIEPNYDPYHSSAKGYQDVIISQVYIEGLFLDKSFVVNIGKMDVHALYDNNALASDETTNFISGAFVRAVGTVGRELNKYYSPAVRLLYSPITWLEAQAIYSHSGVDDLTNNPFMVFQLAVKPGFGDLEGNYRAYVTYDGRNYEDESGAYKGDVLYGFNFDQYVTDHIGIFFRYATHDNSLLVNRVVSMLSGGVTLSAGLWGRADDLLGIGYAQLEANDRLKPPFDEGQTVWEIYYNARINSLLSITPDLQFHKNLPREEKRSVVIYGLRVQADF